MLEILLTNFGGAVNQATGAPLLGTRGARMRNQGIMSKFSGPAAGRADRLFGVGRNFLNGDTERAIDQMKSLVPPFNLLPLKVLSLAYEEFT